jgi:hypothetical protein
MLVGATARGVPGPLCRGFTITPRHTTFGRTPLDEGSARRRDVYLTTHNNHKRQTCMSPAGFEPKPSTTKLMKKHPLIE